MSLLTIGSWFLPRNIDAEVCQGYGAGVVFWPSGRRTLIEYAMTATFSRLERLRQSTPAQVQALKDAKQQALEDSAEDFRAEHYQRGWLIRTKKGRPQARAVNAITWVNPKDYAGPFPNRFGVLSDGYGLPDP
jgi:hypothetical protein